MTPKDREFMQKALTLAEQAAAAGEVPVGALVVKDGKVVAEGWNRPIGCSDPTAHAEIITLRHAAKVLKNYRLAGATLYVTIEPCTMCVGAMIHARIARLVFGASEPRAGAVVSNLHLLDQSIYNHKIEYTGGVLAEPCGELVKTFFQNKRG